MPIAAVAVEEMEDTMTKLAEVRRHDNGTIDIDFYRRQADAERRAVMNTAFKGFFAFAWRRAPWATFMPTAVPRGAAPLLNAIPR
jgi:hypothetical protein